MKFSTRELVWLAVFGAAWGLVEISLGALLHAISLPMSGLVLSTLGLMIALIGRLFVPRYGAVLYIGVIAMLLKLFSIGNVVLGPMVGILAEAFIVEITLDLFHSLSRSAFVIAAALGTLWTLFQPFFTGLVFFGRDLFTVWLDMLDEGTRLLGLPSQSVWLIALTLVVIHLAVGGTGGWLGWNVGKIMQTRMNSRIA